MDIVHVKGVVGKGTSSNYLNFSLSQLHGRKVVAYNSVTDEGRKEIFNHLREKHGKDINVCFGRDAGIFNLASPES